jgi:multidrug efflux pump subunit AcrB
MKPLIKFSLKQGVLLNVVFVGLILFSALIAIPNLPIEQFPNFAFGEIQINTSYPGASANEVERLVTQKIEDSLRGMKSLDYVKSTSRPDRSMINVKFVDDTDYRALYDELRFRIMGIQNQLPVHNGDPLTPRFSEADVDEWLPVIQVNLVAQDANNPISKRTLMLLAKDLRLRLEQIDQVKKVLLLGDSAEQYAVSLDPEKLEKHRLTLQEVTLAMRASGQAMPAGTINTSSGERLIRIDNRFRSKQDIIDVAIRKDGNGNIITIEDLIDHENSGVENLQGGIINTVNGLNMAGCKILKLSTGNALKIKDSIIEEVQSFLKDNSAYGVKAVYTMDSTNNIKDGLGVLASSLLLSAVFVMTLLFLFLANASRRITIIGLIIASIAAIIIPSSDSTFTQAISLLVLSVFVMLTCREAVLTVSGIVFSFLGSLLVFYLTGQSINELTLLGFVIVSGIVVDDAIVVIENIKRHRELGKNIQEAVIDGTSEVFWPVISASLTTMAAFLPLLLMTGTVGDFFSLVPIAVSVALCISLIECLFLLPLHVIDIEKILGKQKNQKPHTGEQLDDYLNKPGLMGHISRLYHKMLVWTLAHPISSIGSTVILFFLAIFILIMPFIGFKPILKLVFFPDNTSLIQITVNMPAGSTLEETDALVREMSQHLTNKGPQKILNTSSQAGMAVSADYKPMMGSQYGYIQAQLPLKENRDFNNPKKFIQEIRQELEDKFEKNGIDLDIAAAKDGPPTGLPLNIRVSGLKDENIMRATNGLIAFIQQESAPGKILEGVIDLKHDRNLRNTIISFKTDRQKLANHGLQEASIQQFIAYSLDGAYIADFRRLDDEIPLKLRLSKNKIKDPVDLLNIPIVNQANGKRILFNDIGNMTVESAPAALIRWDFQRIVTVTGNLSEDSKIGALNVSSRIQQWWQEQSTKYPGVIVSFGGESESTAKSYKSMAAAFLLAMVVIYGILASQFQSYTQPVLIMSNVFFSITGVILLMGLLGLGAEMLPEGTIRPERAYFTVNGFMAVVGLTGLVINDAIVLISFMNKRLADGLPLKQALLIAGHQRMRPIIMTSLTTIAGLMPMAIGIPDFSIAWSPFATAFIAGLTVSTLMTLLILPVLFEIVEKIRRPKQWKIFSKYSQKEESS